MQVTLTKIVDRQKTSQKTGKPFTSRAILCNEHGSKWLSGFAGKENAHWKEGDTVEINVEEKGDYLNFSVPKSERGPGAPSGDLLRVERKVDAVLTEIQMMRGVVSDILRQLNKEDVLAGKLNDGSGNYEKGMKLADDIAKSFHEPRIETSEEPPLSAYEDEV